MENIPPSSSFLSPSPPPQPRSRPVDAADTDTRSAIFGSARPVDTASRELEIEERLRREKEKEVEEEVRDGV